MCKEIVSPETIQSLCHNANLTGFTKCPGFLLFYKHSRSIHTTIDTDLHRIPLVAADVFVYNVLRKVILKL